MSLMEVRKELIQAIESASYPFEKYALHGKMVRDGAFNWQTWVDDYQECYHCITIHPVFNRNFALRRYRVECGERFARHACEALAYLSPERKKDFGFGRIQTWDFPVMSLDFIRCRSILLG